MKKLATIGFCLISLFACKSLAQIPMGSLSGTIEAFNGGPVPNAQVTVKLKSETNPFKRTTTSNEAGEFNFSDIPAGIYEIEIKTTNGLLFKGRAYRVSAGESYKYSIELGTDCENDYGKTIDMSDAEKSEIVNKILEESLAKKYIPDYQFLAAQTFPIILSTKNINPEWIKPLENVKLLSDDEIQQRADKSGDFFYVSFTEFKITGECLIVSIETKWAIAKNSKDEYRYGGGSKYIYRKESGKIVRRMISSWIR